MANRYSGFAAFLVALTLPVFFLLQRPSSEWIDQSYRAFLPNDVAESLSAYQRFPVFWWNFLVFERESGPGADSQSMTKACREFAEENKNLIKNLPCGASFAHALPLALAWVADMPLRNEPPPAPRLQALLNSTLAKASLPLGPDVRYLARLDPFDSLRELEALAQEKSRLAFRREGGLFFDSRSGRVLAPVQFNFPPQDTAKTAEALKTLERVMGAPRLFGPHKSTLENESTVKNDISTVSWVGGSLLALVAMGFFISGRWRLLMFFPPLFLSTAAAIAMTVFVFGEIHGLALAFGPGVIGLSMDYAVHAAFAADRKRATWLANALGVLTTMSVIIVGLLSSIPVLRQLMFFSGSGLLIGFACFFLMHQCCPHLFREKPFFWKLRAKNVLSPLVLILVFVGLIGILTFKPAFHIGDLNFETQETSLLNRWLTREGGFKTPHLQIIDGKKVSALISAEEQAKWARDHGIRAETIAGLLPTPRAQSSNLASWRRLVCDGKSIFSSSNREFFLPFVEKTCADETVIRSLLPGEPSPSYFSDFQSGDQWVSLWFPDSEEQLSELRKRFPDTSSIAEIAARFPKVLVGELIWMAPATFLISFLLLLIYYRSFSLSIASILPFLTGLGAYFAVAAFIEMKVSFITLIGFIMIFGFSLDYGIFTTDSALGRADEATRVRSALTLTSLLTLAGFLPLIFAAHPSMRHLGQALLLGTIGTFLGAIWGAPAFVARYSKARIRDTVE